jgi:type II secretory pathway pseudopilin PulG
MTRLLLLLMLLNIITLVVVTVLYQRTRRQARARELEGANSAYRSQYIEDLESKQRWESLDPELLHEVNREELEKTLAKLRATSVRALSPQERAFLDRMVEAERRVRRSRRRAETERRQGPPGTEPTPAAG